MYAIGNRVYLAEGHTGNIAIYDATDVTNMLLLKRFSIPDAGFVHNVWLPMMEIISLAPKKIWGKQLKFGTSEISIMSLS